MNHKVTLLEDDDYDLNDDGPAEIDFSQAKIDWERTRRFRAQAATKLVRLDPDIIQFFKTPESINEALRRVMSEMKDAA